MTKIDKSDNPFPINLMNYNLLEINDSIHAWLPISENKPFVLENLMSNDSFFIYCHNYFAILAFIESFDFSECDSIELIFQEICEFAQFQNKTNKINAILFCKKYSKTFYFENGTNTFKMLRYIKTENLGDEKKTSFYLDLLNQNNYLPLEKRNGKKDSLEKFYFIDNNNIHLSFDIHEDLPFEIYQNHDGFSYKDYLIPNVKMKRSRFYLPSYIEYNKGDVLGFKYFINNRDYTDKAQVILEELNIKDPVKHQFTEDEITFFVQNIFN